MTMCGARLRHWCKGLASFPLRFALGLATLGTAATALAAGPVQPGGGAAAYGCIKPGIPLCMDDANTFVSADKMSNCQFEVKDYVDRTMSYLKCLNDENVGTGREMTRNVDRFNCRLSGQRNCS